MELTGRRFGHIRVTEVVGQGGMGDVYAGYDEKLERKVALKVLNSDQRLDDEARERLLREARALSKLEHPNICRIHDYIETGDVDLLVLEFIDGKTLHEAMMERMSRAEKLRIATAIAEVLVQAHRAGIVHRDLKPENVMLTRSGEVKVLDFGLARWLNRARARSSDRYAAVSKLSVRTAAVAPAPADQLAQTITLPQAAGNGVSTNGRRAFLATAVGITLGTPLYMSPEQARGETLTPASDMFSFGLLLQVLFTGMEPHSEALTAREVILRVARGATEPVQGAPRDITALINRLKQFAPADRLTAIEAVERLQFLGDKPRRIARRAIVAAVVLFALLGAWRYTVDLKAERAIAVAARADAEQQRAKAEDLMSFMVGDLRKKLEPVGRLDILDDVGARAIKYIESLHPESMSADQLARNAKALNQLGEVRVGQGNTPEALALFRRSLALADTAVKREPRNTQALLAKGASHFWIGNGLRLQGKTDEALQQMREYMNTGEALVAIDPANEEYQLERAYGHSGVALILESSALPSSLTEALQHYRISLQVKETLSHRAPADIDAKAELARAHNKVGKVLNRMGDLRQARKHFEAESAIARGLVASDARNAEWAYRLANNLAYLALVLNGLGEGATAYGLWEEELAIERKLATRDPANVSWQRSMAVTTWRLGTARAARGDHAGAVEMFREARAMIENVIALAPTRKSLVKDRASFDVDYARSLAATTGVAAALRVLDDVEVQLAAIIEAEPEAKYELARAAYLRGELLVAREPAAAERAFSRAAAALESPAKSSTAPFTLDLWARILIQQGRCSEAEAVLTRIRTTGYSTTDTEALSSKAGC